MSRLLRESPQTAAPFRIGCGAGYSGDRIGPARDLAERGQLQALVFECLAERTIALAQARRAADPQQGYDPLLRERLGAVLPACVREGTRIISNMGAANPPAAGQAVLELARELGLKRLRVAVVSGDEVLELVRARPELPLLDSPRCVGDVLEQLVSANAYLGADALLPALQGDADVVISGRVADPALFLAPLMHHFGWRAEDAPMLGRGILVGHLLECAAQVSGGYLADPGFVDVPDLANLGFPLAEVSADGSAVIGLLPGAGGRVDRLSCTAQLLYEIEDPSHYLQPDVTADFSNVQIEELGHNRVRVQGASGTARPLALKVSLGLREGFVGEGQISYGGPGALSRGQLALQVLQSRLQPLAPRLRELRAELIGVNALHGPARGSGAGHGRPGDGAEPAEVRVRLAVRAASRADAERAAQEVEALYLNGPAAGGGVALSVREVLAVESVLIPRDGVRPRCDFLEL
ncbi:MAG: DUF1446 domain-containing protein [Rubrivivax sp.]|nr:DUF1446 domain-containing protein [Rubrivivax sp.]